MEKSEKSEIKEKYVISSEEMKLSFDLLPKNINVDTIDQITDNVYKYNFGKNSKISVKIFDTIEEN